MKIIMAIWFLRPIGEVSSFCSSSTAPISTSGQSQTSWQSINFELMIRISLTLILERKQVMTLQTSWCNSKINQKNTPRWFKTLSREISWWPIKLVSYSNAKRVTVNFGMLNGNSASTFYATSAWSTCENPTRKRWNYSRFKISSWLRYRSPNSKWPMSSNWRPSIKRTMPFCKHPAPPNTMNGSPP